MKPKQNYTVDQDKISPLDCCATPSYGVKPLLPFLNIYSRIWECASGDGMIADYLKSQGYAYIISTDLSRGDNFFEYEPVAWDIIVTNPPYSQKFDWMERAYELGKPFALLLPVETLGSSRAQELFKKYGHEAMYFDSRCDFYMPKKGWNSSAQFPVFWLTYKILPEQTMYVSIKEDKKKFKEELKRQGLLTKEINQEKPLKNAIKELNRITGLSYSYYTIDKNQFWLKRMYTSKSKESVDWYYNSLDEIYNHVSKAVNDAKLFKELI